MSTPFVNCEEYGSQFFYGTVRVSEVRVFTCIDTVYESPESPEIYGGHEHRKISNFIARLPAAIESFFERVGAARDRGKHW